MDRSQFHYYIPETNRQSSEWTSYNEPNSKRENTQQSANLAIKSVFSDRPGIIFIDYIENRKSSTATITVFNVTGMFEERNRIKRSHSKNEKVLFAGNWLLERNLASMKKQSPRL